MGLLAIGCNFDPDPVWPGGDEPDANTFEQPGIDADPAAPDADPSAPDAAPGSPDAAASATGLAVTVWNGQRWLHDANAANAGYPQFNGDEVILTPNQPGRSGVIFLESPISPPFTVSFDYLTSDPDGCAGGCTLSSASGVTFMFGKDVGAYATSDPPTGDARGFLTGSGGGVHFELYNLRRVTVRDSYLTSVKTQSIETFSPSYRHVVIDVHTVGLDVYMDGYLAVTYLPTASWGTAHSFVGFGAATESASAEQRVRNVTFY